MGNARKLVSDMSSQPEDTASPTTVACRQSTECIRRVKRRATMLCAGLKTLENVGHEDWGFWNMQLEFLSVLAKSWVSLPER